MRLTPHLNFNGNCQEAFNFYAKCFEGRVDFKMTYAESPVSGMASPGQQDQILHAHLEAPGFTLIGADAPAGSYAAPTHASDLHIAVDTPEDVDRLLKALGDGGGVMMPPQKTFWCERFGMITDRYGFGWMVGTSF